MDMPRHAATVLVLSGWLAVGTAGEAQTGAATKPGAGAPAVQKVETGAVQSGLASLWSKLRSVSPGFNSAGGGRQSDRAAAQVAGVRGDEATKTSLQPYWKEDDEADPAFKVEMGEYLAAQRLADGAKYADAATAFDAFLQKFPKSRLRSNAQLGAALAAMDAGQTGKGRAALQRFITENPGHPLKGDAERLLRN
jgi:TolA-binding protein